MTDPEITDLPAVIGTCIPIVAMLIGFPLAVISIVGGYWRSAKAAECRAILTQSMIDKGYSVDEIERVLQATEQKPSSAAPRKLCRNA